MYKIYLLLIPISLITFYSCSTQNPANQLKGTWNVEEITLDENNVLWEEQWVTTLIFYEDGTCKLPAQDLTVNRMARWEVKKEGDIHYLHITEAQNSLFNAKYVIQIIEKSQLNMQVKMLELKDQGLYIKGMKTLSVQVL